MPAPNVSIGKKCKPFKIEMVVSGNLVGHAWRTYNSGKRIYVARTMPDGMKENDFFPDPSLLLLQKRKQDMMKIFHQKKSLKKDWLQEKNGHVESICISTF